MVSVVYSRKQNLQNYKYSIRAFHGILNCLFALAGDDDFALASSSGWLGNGMVAVERIVGTVINLGNAVARIGENLNVLFHLLGSEAIH